MINNDCDKPNEIIFQIFKPFIELEETRSITCIDKWFKYWFIQNLHVMQILAEYLFICQNTKNLMNFVQWFRYQSISLRCFRKKSFILWIRCMINYKEEHCFGVQSGNRSKPLRNAFRKTAKININLSLYMRKSK